MREAKGGTFSTADMRLIRKALAVFGKDCSDEESVAVVNLIHRIGRILPEK